MKNDMPLSEYDATVPALIEPTKVIGAIPDFPEHVVMCFFQDAIASLRDEFQAEVIAKTSSEIGDNLIYRFIYNEKPIAVMHAGVGAPLSGSFLEELIAKGGKKFIACGGAGVLDSTIGIGHVVVPNAAIRDEGTSYHYLPASRDALAHPQAVDACISTLDAAGVPHIVGKTWTTDGIYRETPQKIKQRRAEGALVVEMETAAFFAIAQFREVIFGQLLYGGDDVGAEVWNHRDWDRQHSLREKLLHLAMDAVIRL